MRDLRFKFWAIAVLCLTALALPSFSHANTSAGGLRAAEHPDGVTRLVIDLSQSINFTTRLADNPYRIVIDTESLAWSEQPVLLHTTGPILGVSYGEDHPGAHITLKLNRPADVKTAFLIAPRDGAGWRFVVDIKDISKQDFTAQAHPTSAAHLTIPMQPPPLPQPRPAMTEDVKIVEPAPVPAPPQISAPTPPQAPIVITSPAAIAPMPPAVMDAPPPDLADNAKPQKAPVLSATLPPSGSFGGSSKDGRNACAVSASFYRQTRHG